MANDINKEDPHYKGEYGSIYEVNRKFPTGGVVGDFVVIDGWAHYWNAGRGTWCVNAERDSYWDELITNIIEKFKLVRGATYMGVASLDTVPTKVIGAKMYYFATIAGTYKNFGDLVVPQGINVLYSENGSSWVNTTLLEVAQELGVSTNKVVSQKALNDALAKKFDKENIAQEFGDSEDKVVSQFALPFREIESPEFIKVIVDANDHLLFTINLDGEVDWGKGIPAPIKAKFQDIINQCQQDKTDLLGILDKTTIKDEEGIVFETPFRYIQNEEFIFAKVDAEDRLLFGIEWDGTPRFGKTSAVEDRLQEQVTLLAEKVATIIGDEDTTNVIDTMNELKTFFANIENTQSLTDILTNLDNVAKNLDKTTIKDEEGNVQDTPFRVIENEEFLKAIVDAEDRVLFGFYRTTGEPYYPLNEMYHVIQNKEYFAAWLDEDDKVVLGIRRDGEIIGEIHAVNALKKVISQLQSDLASLQEKVGTIDTNLKELLDVFSFQENPEYLAVEKDADGKVLSATNNDGSHYIHNAKSETIPEEFEHIEDLEGRTEITIDADGKVFGYRDSEGTRHEHKMKVGNLNVDNLNLGSNAQKDVLDFINSQPKVVNVRKWHLPSYGTVNIKQETFFLTANDGYTDKSGIYPIVINEDTQENAKKGLTVLQFFVKSTLKDEGNGVFSKLDNSIGLDFYVPSKVTYVNEVPYVTSSLTKNELDGTYSVNETSIKVTKITDTPTIGAWSVDKKTEHQCVVDIDFGHYLKGTFYIGVKYQGSSTLYKRKRNFRFTFYKDSSFSKKDKIKIGEMVRTSGYNLKANYTDQSRVKEFIMNRILMDIWEHREDYHNYPWNSEKEPYSGATGMIKGFPIRVNIGGKFYGLDIFGLKKDEKNYLLDGDASGMIVSGTRGNANDPNNWTAAKPEDWEDEMNDELTESNKQALSDFFSFINSENFTKENVPQRMSVIDWIDYFINLQVFLMRDNTCRNMILYTGSDKKIFYPFFYDLDLSWSFDSTSSNLDIMTKSFAADMSLWENFRTLYKDEISNRYAYLRGTVLNIDYINTIYQEILSAIPQEDIDEEKKKWDAGNVSYMETLINVLNKRFDWLDKEYFKV